MEVRGVAAIASFTVAVVASCSVLVGAAGATTLTAAPTIVGLAQQGRTLTVSAAGLPGPAGDTFDPPTYQWLVCTSTCTNGPAGSSFPLTAAEVGATIDVTESVNDTSLTAATPNPATATSAATAVVLPLPWVPSPAPSISGLVQQGQTLTADPGTWSPLPAGYTFAWTSGGVPVGTGQTYTLAPTDVGKVIGVSVTATFAGISSAAVSSAPTAPVLPLAPVNLTPPAIAGTPQEGQVLTLTQGTWANNPSLTEQWQDCTGLSCTSISGQTGTSYTVGPNDVGHTIRVVETAINVFDALTGGVQATSAETGTVSATSSTSVVAFSQNTPTTNEAVTLVATISSDSGKAHPHGSLSFFNGFNTIPGCANKGVSGGQTITIVCQASFGAGAAQISAAYVADPTSLVADSSSDTTPLTIGKGGTGMLLAVTPKVAPRGRATYVATLGVPTSNAGPILPTGSIAFLDGGQPIRGCSGQALSNLTARCIVSYPVAGAHSITASYEGDANFTGSTSSASAVQIVAGAPMAPVVRGGTLGSTLGWTVHYGPRYSWLSALTAFAVPRGTTIFVQCFGKGCPFGKWKLTKKVGTVNLVKRFGHRHLRAGTRITLRFTRKNWIGKYYAVVIRAGRKPKITSQCLAPGRVKPGVGCRSK